MKKNFGRLLKRARMKAGLSQGDLARSLGYRSQFVSNAERCVSMLPKRKIEKLAEKLNIKPRTIVNAMTADYRDGLMRFVKRP